MEGYDAKFDPPLEKRLECPICLLAQREPMQTPCGHRFCSACILRALRETGPRCPVDNTTVCIHQLFRDNFAKREVLSLNVHCSADQCGCSWQGELRDLQLHSKQCKLVLVRCPNSCGHSCRRNLLPDHVTNCTNKPVQCPTCSIHFPRNSLPDHKPHCSQITLPDSVSASVDKALLPCTYCRVDLQGGEPGDETVQYLSDARSTGCWCNTISLITLNSLASHIFSRMLQSSEVQPVQLNFALLTSDAKSVAFQKIFRKKPDICNAAVCLRLRTGNRRETRELTIMYLSWSEQHKRLLAHVANLKTHLVRQIQRMRSVSSHSHSGQHHTNSTQPQFRSSAAGPLLHHSHSPHHTHSNPHPHIHVQRQAQQQMINLQPVPPRNDIQSVVQSHQVVTAATAGSSPAILPNLLSWQMSQSFNTYPWRMQATGVPFFTFPSTPPSYIPANSYPYTFAPLPAAPFSISPMQPVPSSVHMPSYNGLSVMVPQVTTVDANAVPLNPNQNNMVTQGYAVAAPNAAVPPQPMLDPELQAVTVTLSGEGNPVLHVLQSHTTPHPDRQMHQYHQNIPQAPLNIAPTVPPALIPTAHPQPPPQATTNTTTPFMYEVVSQPVHSLEHLPSGNSQPNQHLHRHSSSLTSLIDSSRRDNRTTHLELPLDDTRVMWADVPGPSGLNLTTHTQPDSASSRDSTPEIPNFSSFSSDNDSNNSDTSQTPNPSISPALFDESISSLSSDREDSPANHTPGDSSTDSSTASALHTLADAAAILADSPTPAVSPVITAQHVHTLDQPLRLPVLINISDSDSDSRLSPSSIIDLTHSPTTSSNHPALSTRSNSYNYNVVVSALDRTTQHAHTQLSSHPVTRQQEQASSVHGDNRISAVLVPVIHQWNSTTEHQGLRQMQHYLPNEQVGIVQAAPISVDEIVHPSTSLNSESSVVAPVQQPYAVQDYPNRGAAVTRWPAELPPPTHAVQHTLLYPPRQAVSNNQDGDFWDTVIPSLDMTLQHSTTSDN